MRINEIFYSLQGEGRWTGTPMVFIRFSGCNLKCSFCDTDHSKHIELSVGEIINEARKIGGECHRVCLTGGEPSLQISEKLIAALHENGYKIHIETNGTTDLPAGIDWITVSPKTEHIALKEADELKLVYQGEDVSEWESFPASCHYLQPCSCQNTKETTEYVLAHPKWQLSLQTHKYLETFISSFR
ncbi:MAG: 7-carboxy-7-deazaguanine synthase QueE [Bacteroidales bacterium]